MNATKLVIVAVAIALFIAACSQSSQAPANNQTAQSSSPATATKSAPPSEAEVAAKLYAENCQICHKDTGKGGKNLTIEGKKISPADLTSDKAKKHTDENLIKDISEGATDDGMPAFKDKLTPQQMKQIVLHVRRLQTPIANS